MLLCPHSAITTNECLTFPKRDVLGFNRILEQTPSRMAKLYGVPCLMANKVGSLHAVGPWPFGYFPSNHTFPGYSSICSSGDGISLSAANKSTNIGEIEVMVGTVYLGEDNKMVDQVMEDISKIQHETKSPWQVMFCSAFSILHT